MTIEDLSSLSSETTISGELAVIGAGPAGITVALEAAKRGVKVLLVESGGEAFDPAVQELSEAAEWDHERHAPMSMTVRRQIGGTSTIWGGRCVPYDPIDFETRPFVGVANWPVTYDEISGYFQRACDWFLCGRAMFDSHGLPNAPSTIVPGLVDGDVTTSALERWSLPTDFAKSYSQELQDSANVRVLTGLTATEIFCPAEHREAECVKARTLAGTEVLIAAKAFVIACGGLESTRLLMNSRGPQGGQMGGESGDLGRWYMAHGEGTVSNVQFSTPPKSTVYSFERDIDRVYVHRRLGFTKEFQLAQELPNVAGWLHHRALPDAAHNSGELSMVYLVMKSRLGEKLAPEAIRLTLIGTHIPGTPNSNTSADFDFSPKSRHAGNILRQPIRTGRFVGEVAMKKVLTNLRRTPGFSVYNKDNNYPIQFHSEHLPHADSYVELSRQTDALGVPKLNINLRFSDADVDAVVRAHHFWDAHLRERGVGYLEYPQPDLHEVLKAQFGGGFHQIGTTRMSADPSHGVVDGNLAVHGVGNVFVASSSTFVTSGQANPTFMIVAFAVRLADYLAQTLRKPVTGTQSDLVSS